MKHAHFPTNDSGVLVDRLMPLNEIIRVPINFYRSASASESRKRGTFSQLVVLPLSIVTDNAPTSGLRKDWGLLKSVVCVMYCLRGCGSWSTAKLFRRIGLPETAESDIAISRLAICRTFVSKLRQNLGDF